MASPILADATASDAKQPLSTVDGEGELSRFVGANRTEQDLWWLRNQFDILTKKLKLYGPHFEDELSTLEKAIEMFGDKEPEKADKDAQRAVEVTKRLMKDYRKSLDEDYEKSDVSKKPVTKPIIEAFYTRLSLSQENHASQEPAPGKLRRAGTKSQFESEKVQRVKINSDTLSEELQDITGIRLGFTPLFASPFKLFVQYYSELQERLVELRNEFAGTYGETDSSSRGKPSGDSPVSQLRQPAEASTSPPQPFSPKQPVTLPLSTASSEPVTGDATPTSQEDPETRRQKQRLQLRINHLQCLCDFIRSDLGHILAVRDRIADRSIQTIAFEDLWHLFRPGDLVMSTDRGRKQLFIAFHITGGQVRKRKRTRVELDEYETAHYRLDNMRNRHYEDPRDEEDLGQKETLEKAMAEETNYSGSWGSLMVNCYMLVSDGLLIGPEEHYISITPFAGEKLITELEVFPLRFHPQQEAIVDSMEKRGRIYLNSPGHQSYDGLSLILRRRETREDLHGEVYIDVDSYYAIHPAGRPKFGNLQKSKADRTQTSENFESQHDEVDLIDSEVDDKLTEDYLASDVRALEPATAKSILQETGSHKVKLMPHRVIGYVFRSRRWYALDLDLLKPIDKSDAARRTGFQDLVIGDQQRKLLVALVENHEAGQKIVDDDTRKYSYEPPVQIDLVRGKGRGLIILLHGPPGSGKTSTAETIAAYTSRPLYAITCGDIGSTSREVEINLEEHARRAEKWGCVLLLDEADVFLAGRNRYRNAERNALVSIFLRQLEYYSGILFLTTNRVGEIDEAFKSRVHVALRYPKIDLASTLQIWTSTMRRLKRENAHRDIKIEFQEQSLLNWASKNFRKLDRDSSGEKTWNGRQIRNAFQTAVSLAHFERPEKLRNDFGMTVEQADQSKDPLHKRIYLEKELFKQIADIATEFEDYLSTVRGPDQRLAMQSALRNDGYQGGGAEGAMGESAPPPRKAYAALAERARNVTSSGGVAASASSGRLATGDARGGSTVSRTGDESAEEGSGSSEDESD